MYSNTSALAPSLVLQTLWAVSSVFSDEKKLSIAALSQTLPDRLVEQVIRSPVIRRWNLVKTSGGFDAFIDTYKNSFRNHGILERRLHLASARFVIPTNSSI